MTELCPELEKLVQAGRAAARPEPDDFERVRVALEGRLATKIPPFATPRPWFTPKQLLTSPYTKAAALALAGTIAVLGYAKWPASRQLQEAQMSRPIGNLTHPTPLDLRSAPATSALNASLPQSQPDPPSAPATSTVKSLAPSPAKDSLSEEVALLARAERELYRGNAGQALATLREHEMRFARGALSEERTAAKIHALCALGRTEEATALLTRLKPSSLHGQSARDACSQSGKAP